MPALRTEWTVEMLDDLPDDGKRYELIDGELFVTPAPSTIHQLIVQALGRRLWDYLRPTAIGRAVSAPLDVRREDRRRNSVQPDVVVLKLQDGAYPDYPHDLSDLLLVIEVLSPSNSKYDYQTKRELYLRAGVPEYWIVDPEAQTFARWTSLNDPGELITDHVIWHPAGLDTPLEISLRDFFEDALG